MASLRGQPSLDFGVKVVRVAGLGADHLQSMEGGSLFVRYCVPAGDGRRRLRVDTREVPCAGCGDASWGELARFERWGCAAAAAGLAFELRWRPPAAPSAGLSALLGRRPSRVLARAELAWRDVETSQAPAAERWLPLSPAGRELGVCKQAPRLLVEVRIVRAAAGDEVMEQGRSGGVADERCSCGECGWVGSEEDMFLAATFS
ncbi:hypothetical protein ACP70R_011554 [Stipagrostis hirtigluma subsp. patula]